MFKFKCPICNGSGKWFVKGQPQDCAQCNGTTTVQKLDYCKHCPCAEFPMVFAPRSYSPDKRKRSRLHALLVGESPGSTELIRNTPFVGKAGRYLDYLISHAKIQDCAYQIQNACKCAKGSDESKKPPVDAFEHCATFLHKDIKDAKPHTIVLLGNFAVRSMCMLSEDFKEQSLEVARSRKISALDGIPFEVWFQFETFKLPLTIIPTYHPMFYLYNMTPAASINAKRTWETIGQVIRQKGDFDK